MKKLMLLAILMTGLQAMAIYQYGGYVGKTTDSNGNTIYQYSYKDNGRIFSFEVVEGAYSGESGGTAVPGSAYMIRVTAGTGSIYLTDKISNIYNVDANREVFSSFVNVGPDGADGQNYGYVSNDGTVHNAAGERVVVDRYRNSESSDPITQYGYKLGEFKAGEELTVWLRYGATGKTGATAMNYTDSPLIDNSLKYRDFSDSYVSNTNPFSQPLGQLSFSYNQTQASAFFGLSGKPLGQPLPGVLISLLLGCGAVATARKLSKRD